MASKSTPSLSSAAAASKKSPASPSSATASGKPKPSDRLNPKTIDPFNKKQAAKSSFAVEYNNGNIPCRLNHGSVKHKLEWKRDISEVQFDPTLVLLATGLPETSHPYTFLSENGFKELLEQPDASARMNQQLVDRIVPHIKLALCSETRFEAGLNCLEVLSQVVQEGLNVHLKGLMQQLAKKSSKGKIRDRVMDVLQVLEQNGGKDALLAIKEKIPTYTPLIC
ncbi:PACRG-like protein [Symsagittifera roscoffensis]|uniref:PACRG-like protein n=1 Tax=Symsagittifera roscoffensis TaxID=84072 RepID=UPI00307BAC92